MMNLTSKTSKSFLLFKRAWVLLCLVLCSLMANAGGTNWTPVYQVKTTSSSRSTGQGKVYVQSGTEKSSEEELGVKEEKTIQLRGREKTIISSNSSTYSHTFSDITLYAVPADGSTFEGWDEDPTPSKTSVLLENSYTWTNRNGNSAVVEGDYVLPESPKHYHPIFTARIYQASGQSIGIITLDAEGNVSSEVGGSVSTDGTNWSATAIAGGNIVTQSADDQGKKAQATFLPRFHAQPNAGYKLIGWATTPEEAADIYANNLANPDQKPANPYQNPDGIVSTAEQGSGATPPSLGSLYAVFVPSIYYYHLGAAVGIAGDPNEWDAKGRVYADNGDAITTGVPEDQWTTSMQDENVYSQPDNKVYKYTYYAKVLDPTKVAFKGWTTSPNGEPSYFSNPLVDYEHTVTDDNTSDQKPFRTPTLYAVFESYYYKTPAVAVANNSKGAGFVNVSLTEGLSLDLCTKEEIAASAETHQVPATGTSHAYKVAYYAKNKPGTKFEYWSSTPDGSNIVSYDAIYVEDFETSATDANFPHVAPALYAVFSSDIDIRQQDRMIVYIDEEGNGNINDSKVLIDFQKGNTLTATLIGDDVSYFTLSNRSGSKSGSSITFDATQGLIELVVAYKGDLNDAVGKVANITLSATSGGQNIERPVTIVVEEAPIITFLPTDGKGKYKVSMTNGSGINYTMNAATKENIKVPITHESMSNIEIALQSDVDTDDYYFFGWQMIDGNDVTYLSYEQLFTYQFTKPVTVRADFVHKDIATYYIVDDPTNTQYHDFALVMSDAEKLVAVNGTQTVMLNDVVRGVPVTKAVLPKGNYTIPTGVRFIVPGKEVKTYREALEQSDYKQSNADEANYHPEVKSYKEYIRWVVEEGTNITVESGASVSVLSNIAVIGASSPNGLPFNYGHIELNQNCKMEFLGDSKLFAYGYVTGPESSSILMKDQSLVKEVLQVYDWRGGTATSMGYLFQEFQSNKVFLINQYFVQNIEAPLTITAGATEELDAALNVNTIANISMTFISPNSGFCQLSNGYSYTKYYDKYSDRVRMTIKKDNGATGSAELGSIALNLTGLGEVNSANFVLPLPHNYDIILGENTVTNVLHDMALLPGATVHVKEGAVCNLGVSSTANLFVYDQKYSKVDGTGYMGSANKEFFTISSRPDGLQYTRTSATIQDAKLIVDGTLNTPNGYIYTTNLKTETTDHACITSNGGGKVQFNALGTKTDTKQGTHKKTGINVVSIPVAPARLLHGNGTYQEPSANTTYTYINNRWTANTAETEKPEAPVAISRVPVFTVTNYTTSSYVGKSSTGTTTISTNNTNVDWTKVTWTYQLYGEHADQFAFAWATKPNGTITFTPESDGTKKATLRITATYSYKDAYEVTGKYVYSKDINLTGNASYLNNNTLKFANLSTVFVGQNAIPLFTGDNKNSLPITITTSPADIVTISDNTASATLTAKAVGEVIITATQAPDLINNIAGITLTKRIKVTEPVVWNWSNLYFGTINTNPVTVYNGATSWTIVEKEDTKNIIDFQGSFPDYTATIADMIAGEYTVTFTYSDNTGYTKDFVSTIYTNPRRVRVDVNKVEVFKAVTLSANSQVNFDNENKAITFQSSSQAISQWKMTFIGVPDKICFIPIGVNTWQIEESTNGVNWTTSMPWKYLSPNVPFEMSLLPSSQYVRISYGAGDDDLAYLKELYITELADVKADVKKMYMPIDNVNNAVKEVVLTYANTGRLDIRTSDASNFKVKFSDSNSDPNDVLSIPATTEDDPFGIKGIEVVCYATEKTTGELQVYNGSQLLLQIPIYAYQFPQDLPIKLATDEPAGGDRYYFVTTHSHNTEWDGTDGVRTITMNNAVSDAAPYVTFAFNGNPTFISFDYTSSAKGTWKIEQSGNGKDFDVALPKDDDEMADGKLHRSVPTTAKYIRVIYESAYAEKIDIQNLTIVGGASVVASPTKLELDHETPKNLTLTAINLLAVDIATSSPNFKITTSTDYTQVLSLNSTTNPSQLGENKMGDIILGVKWTGNQMVEYGSLVVTNPNDGDAVLATVELVGIMNSITDGEINIHTGVPSGYSLDGFDGSSHRPVNIDAAFSADATPKPLFDYVVVYGETTTNDGQSTISAPNKNAGSNAKTPYYVYKKSDNGESYKLNKIVENANSGAKAWWQNNDDAVLIPAGKNEVSMYITGFCPYASTGYTKDEEGVWYFRANGGQSIHVYLEDCYIYSRAKTVDGHTFADRSDGYSFVDAYVRGSGSVLAFACDSKQKENEDAMNVTIHTLGTNVLKSNYGCFLQSIAGRAYQASSPIQVRLIDDTYASASKTTLNFTDEWPASQNAMTGDDVRTNGFLSLQKQVNNAPSIDLGNANTVVNFRGGQVELENAQVVSDNYSTSMAISFRSGEFAGFFLAYGMGSDDVGGTVNFIDGTTTVKKMYVEERFRQYYLMDEDGVNTSCLRCPAQTYVSGGSHCMMRACETPTSKGGAPRNKPATEVGSKLLGLYKYPKYPEDDKKGGWALLSNGNGLVDPTSVIVPDGYSVNSVTPNTNGTTEGENAGDDDFLNFWFDPDFEPAAKPEVDQKISFWKACMTEIAAEYGGYGGSIGGDVEIELAMVGEKEVQTEIVSNLLYCVIDNDIHTTIRENYTAPVKSPLPSGGYIPVTPSRVGDQAQHYINNTGTYVVEDKIYYITTINADTWMTFTAPFNVEKIYAVEAYPEQLLREYAANVSVGNARQQTKAFQSVQNAHFAAFFGVAMVIHPNKTFDMIYDDYLGWAEEQDGVRDLRGMYEVEHYHGSNWSTANYYLFRNTGDWEIAWETNIIDGEEYLDPIYTTAWERVPELTPIQPIMQKGETYSLIFPYDMKSASSLNTREEWDYWSGKFLIFESTVGPHEVNGSDIHANLLQSANESDTPTSARVSGNSTFALMENPGSSNVFTYLATPGSETFILNDGESIKPTTAFLVANPPTNSLGMPARGVKRTGEIIYDDEDNNGNQNGTSGGHIPTVGGGNDLFITSIAGGINVAVAAPQNVRVLSSTGAVIYSGYVTTAVDIQLPTTGIYIVSGENEVQKILF